LHPGHLGIWAKHSYGSQALLSEKGDPVRTVPVGRALATCLLATTLATAFWVMEPASSRSNQATYVPVELVGGSPCADISPDGELIALGFPGGVEVRNLSDGTRVAPGALGKKVVSLAWSPNGGRLAVGTSEGPSYNPTGGLLILNATNLQTIWATNQSKPIRSLSWSPEGRLLAYSVYVGVEIRNMTSFRAESRLEIFGTSSVHDPKWSPNGKKIAYTCYRDGESRLQVWSWPGEHLLHEFAMPAGDGAGKVAWSPTGELVAARTDHAIYIWNSSSVMRLATIFERNVKDLEWSEQKDVIASSSSDGYWSTWNITTGRMKRTEWFYRYGPMPTISVMEYTPDHTKLIMVTDEGDIGIWDAQTGIKLGELPGKGAYVRAVWLQNSTIIAQNRRHQIVTIHIGEKGPVVELLPELTEEIQRTKGSLTDMASGGNNYLALIFHPAKLRIWDLRTNSAIASFDLVQGAINTYAFSPQGDRLAWSQNKDLWVLDLPQDQDSWNQTGSLLHAYGPTTSGLAWSPDSKELLCADPTGNITVRDSQTLKIIEVVPTSLKTIWGISESPSGAVVPVLSGKEALYRLSWNLTLLDARTWRVLSSEAGGLEPYWHPFSWSKKGDELLVSVCLDRGCNDAEAYLYAPKSDGGWIKSQIIVGSHASFSQSDQILTLTHGSILIWARAIREGTLGMVIMGLAITGWASAHRG